MNDQESNTDQWKRFKNRPEDKAPLWLLILLGILLVGGEVGVFGFTHGWFR
ncbi:MAG: hypothetical protein RLZZ67_104 [Candidatus Parcubacteria bacterium]|jgi:hypothetical protein